MMCRILRIGILFFLFVFLSSAPIQLRAQSSSPSHHVDGGFRNPEQTERDPGLTKMAPWLFKRLEDNLSKSDVDIPRTYNDGSLIAQNKPYTVTWIGHSTLLIQLEGKTILTDPVWSDRVGPVSWAGTIRLTEPGLPLAKLPPIDIVLISHNHYDHLDEPTIMQLAKNPNTKFFVPLRVRDWFEDRGISNVQEFDWWEGISYAGLKIICTPTQHFSGRWLTDRDETLWCSWVVMGKKKRIFFGGDSGYFKGFARVGTTFGPFDLTMIPIGAYEPRELLHTKHMNPAEAVQAHLDLKGKRMVAIHWGTYKQTDEPLEEPPRKLREEIRGRSLSNDDYWTLMIGETREF
jgi:N-acyl-phosphatidylethanolamine-hydrolysing phospholipase D